MGVLQVSAGVRKVQCGEECKSIASQINYEAIAGKFSTGKEVSTLHIEFWRLMRAHCRGFRGISSKRFGNVGAGASAPIFTLAAIYQLPKLPNSQSSQPPLAQNPTSAELTHKCRRRMAPGAWHDSADEPSREKDQASGGKLGAGESYALTFVRYDLRWCYDVMI